MRRTGAKSSVRRATTILGLVAAFFVIAAPGCRDYNGGGPTDAAYTLRVSPAVACRDGIHVVLVRELRQPRGDTWDGGRDDRITMFRGSAPDFQTRPLDVLANEPVDFVVDDDPAAVWPGFEPRYPDLAASEPHPFSVAVADLPWQGNVALDVDELLVGQTYTDRALYSGIPAAPPLGRPPLGPNEILQPTDPYFDIDPTLVAYDDMARVFPGRQADGYPTFDDPADVDEEDPVPVLNCWLFSQPAGVDIRPGVARNFVAHASGTPTRVGVLSAPDFDATRLDFATVRVGTAPITTIDTRDLDHDGDLDLLATFVPARSGMRCGDTSIAVTGRSLEDRRPFRGTDTIVTTPCR